MERKTTISNMEEMKVLAGAHEILKSYKKGDTLIVMHVKETETGRQVGGSVSLNVKHVPEVMKVMTKLADGAISELAEEDPMEAAKLLAKMMVDQKMKKYETEED